MLQLLCERLLYESRIKGHIEKDLLVEEVTSSTGGMAEEIIETVEPLVPTVEIANNVVSEETNAVTGVDEARFGIFPDGCFRVNIFQTY